MFSEKSHNIYPELSTLVIEDKALLSLIGELEKFKNNKPKDYDKNIYYLAKQKEFYPLKKKITDQLKNYKGYSLVIIEDLTSELSDAFLLFFSFLIGSYIEYQEEGPKIMLLKPEKGLNSKIVSYRSANEMKLHTDLTYYENMPDAMGLFCVKRGQKPYAQSRFARLDMALNLLSEKDKVELLKPHYDFRKVEISGHSIEENRGQKILEEKNGDIYLRIRSDNMKYLSDEGKKATDNLQKALEEVCIELTPNENSLILFNNRFLAHGRTDFKATYDNNDRLLKRIYINFEQESPPTANSNFVCV